MRGILESAALDFGLDRILTSFALYFCPPGCLTLMLGLGAGADICFLGFLLPNLQSPFPLIKVI